jgi:hypothetical protein
MPLQSDQAGDLGDAMARAKVPDGQDLLGGQHGRALPASLLRS